VVYSRKKIEKAERKGLDPNVLPGEKTPAGGFLIFVIQKKFLGAKRAPQRELPRESPQCSVSPRQKY